MNMNVDIKKMLWLMHWFIGEHTEELEEHELVWLTEARNLLTQAHNSILRREEFR